MAKPIVIKIGGNTIGALTDDFYELINQYQLAGHPVVIVHGGGPMISQLCQALGVAVKKRHGIRVTDEQTLSLTKLVLLGQAQPQLAQQLTEHGFQVNCQNAASNFVLMGQIIDAEQYGWVGKVTAVKQASLALSPTTVTIMSPLAIDETTHHWLNVNADTAAATIAAQLGADELLLMTDVAGVMQDGQRVGVLTQQKAKQLIDQAVISRGMIPKIKAAFRAKVAGVKQIKITNQLAKYGTKIE